MPILPMPNGPQDDLNIALGRVEIRDGFHLWPEVFAGQIAGFRPLSASVAVPEGAPASGTPLVVVIHGGGWSTGHPHVTNPNLDAMDIPGMLLAAGYAVARISYRLSAEARFPAQIQDCKAWIRYLRHHSAIFGTDPDRIGVLGESAGGHLALLLGMETPAYFDDPRLGPKASSAVQAVVAWYPPTDFLTIAGQMPAGAPARHDSDEASATRLLGQRILADPEAARRASPVTYVSARTVPTFLQHGTADSIVPVGQSEELFALLQAERVPSALDLVPGANHCFYGVETDPILPAAIAFLDRWLKPRAA